MRTLTAESNLLPNRSRTITAVALVLMFSAGTRSPHAQSSIHRVAGGNDVSLLSSLLSGGADSSAIGPAGQTPLHFAASSSENPEMILALVAAGAYVDAADDDGFSPLHVALKENRGLDIVATLLTAGADVNRGVSYGVTHGEAKVGGSRWSGWSPLHLAAQYGQDPAIVSLLISMGANLNDLTYVASSWDWSGRFMTPLDMARDTRRDAIIRTLRDAGARPYRESHVADAEDDSGRFNWGKAAAIAGIVGVGAKAAEAGVPVDTIVETTAAAIADIVEGTGGENLARVAGNQDTPGTNPPTSPSVGPMANARSASGIGSVTGGQCEIPAVAALDPEAFDPNNTRVSYCNVRLGGEFGPDHLNYYAVNAELLRCQFTMGAVAADKVAVFREEMKKACDLLDAMASRNGADCRCPPSYYELGRD